jgi:hypothetical protein
VSEQQRGERDESLVKAMTLNLHPSLQWASGLRSAGRGLMFTDDRRHERDQVMAAGVVCRRRGFYLFGRRRFQPYLEVAQ